MGSKPIKSGEGVVEVKYNSQGGSRNAHASQDGDSYGVRSTPSSTPPPADYVSSEAHGKGKSRKGFTYSNAEKHRRDCPRETKMMDDEGASIDNGFSFRREKVQRIPTRAVLKPPKNKDSVIAQPDDMDDDYNESHSSSLPASENYSQ